MMRLMCGIAGVVALGAEPVSRAWLDAMETRVAHRGPDGSGVFMAEDGCFGLVHRRLAILDLSSAGLQPMWSASGRYLISFNGEVYNYVELRAELEAQGRVFKTRTDTEVVLAAFEEWGDGCWARFNGMWAIALWDSVSRRLVLCRDRFGVKPLFVVRMGGFVGFGSEVPALLALPFVVARPAADVVARYLIDGIHDEGVASFYEGILSLAPGTWLSLGVDGDSYVGRYWDLPSGLPEELSYSEAVSRFGAVLGDSVRLRLRSDVPVGACLSGGLDSSAIVCLASGLGHADLHTFTSASDDPAWDESAWASQVAKHARVEWHSVRPTAAGFLEDMHALLDTQAEPFGSLSMYAQWKVMQEARRCGIPVLLDGQGADELLAGYGHWGPFLADLVTSGQLSATWRELEARSRVAGGGAVTMARIAASAASYVFPGLRGRVLPGKGLDIASSRVRDQAVKLPPGLQVANGENRLEAELRTLFSLTRLPALLRYEDRNSMHFAIETRLPFLDYRLVELGFHLPGEMKLRGGWSKAVLRDAMAGILPEPVRMRRDKNGFATAEGLWWREGLGELAFKIFSSSDIASREFVDPSRYLALLAAHRAGKADHRFALWRGLNLELWLRKMSKAA